LWIIWRRKNKLSNKTWSCIVNDIRDALYNTLKNAKIKNNKGIIATVYKRNLPIEPSKDDCPIISIFKKNSTGEELIKDQPSLELPRIVYLVIGICDYSADDLDEAEVKTDGIIDKIFVELNANPSLNNLVRGIRVKNVVWDEANVKNMWFSLPTIELSVQSIFL